MASVVLITGAGSGMGKLAAETLAKAGHTVYAGLHSAPDGSQQPQQGEPLKIHLDITDTKSINEAVGQILSAQGRLDVVVHNAGHMCMGPAESFSAEQMHQYYEINTVGAHRLNQAVLPIMRKAGQGHIVWVSSSSARGGSGPLLGPYFAAKAAMHSLALTMSVEVACWGIETTIVVPGIFTKGTNHFANAGKPAYPDISKEYMEGPLKNVDTVMMENIDRIYPKDATPQLVGDAILQAVNAPRGQKPFRLPVDPLQDGSNEIMTLADEKHEEFLKRCGIYDMVVRKQ